MIRAEGVGFAYSGTAVLDGVDVTVADGRVLGLVGPNGSGKTTLLRALHGALVPSRGRVLLDGADVTRLRARDVARRVAVVVQEHGGDLPLLVSDVVLMGRAPHRSAFSRTSAADHRTAADALARVGALHLAGRRLSGLSGGEKQRVLVARALVQEAAHLLLDEPTNHLDVRYQHEVLDLVRSLVHGSRDAGGAGDQGGARSAVVVLHDLNLALRYCDDVAVLHRGRLVAAGAPADVLVPAVLAPVYEVSVRRVDLDVARGEGVPDGPLLAFRPRAGARTPPVPEEIRA
ncbi:ABC transporter ATP-binding protein [Kineococcus sp. SYSU DK004]|uniref:ABC transporter ATP-binding protein n=1 Tax=Kineococcus sp. SYSU DK004 TaxID=3383125 RepID=UPI003D7E1CED